MSRAGRAALWSGAAVLVAAVHLAALDWLSGRAIGTPVAALPEVIEIDLIVPDPTPTVDERPADPPPEPEAAPEPVFDLPPLIPLPPLDLTPEPKATPAPRPKPDETARKPDKPKPPPGKPAPQTPAKGAAPVEGKPKGPAVSTGAMQSWQDKAIGKIAAHMARTRASGRGQAVPVTLAVTIAVNGQVSARLAGSTGDARLDAAISRQAARMPRVAPPPDGRAFSFTRTIRVQFR